MNSLVLILLLTSIVGFAQERRLTKSSKEFDVVVKPGPCADDNKCGPITVTLYKKRSQIPVQALTGSRILRSDLDSPVQFADFDFDGFQDLALFDGYTAPGGNITAAKNIYIYSPRKKQFELNSEMSSLSHAESMDVSELDKKKKLIITYARTGSGVFRSRSYAMKTGKPVMVEEVVFDSQVDNGTRTRITTRKLINGRWREWTKHTKTILKQ